VMVNVSQAPCGAFGNGASEFCMIERKPARFGPATAK